VFQDNGVDPNGGLVDQGPPIYTRGTVTAGSGLTVTSGGATVDGGLIVNGDTNFNGVVTVTDSAVVEGGSFIASGELVTNGSLTSVNIASAAYATPNTTYTIATGTNVFSVGQLVTVSGVTVASGLDSFNVVNATVTAITATTVVVVAFPNGSTGTATSATGTITGYATAAPVIAVTAVASAGGVVTYTTGAVSHNYRVGQLVTAYGFTGTAAPYNLVNVVIFSVPTNVTFTVASGVTGAKTYLFVVGSTEGDFVAVVVPTEIVENNSKQTNLSLAYSVKAGTASVSNADVLKSIVALIASINKQIQALQKLILKR
jgi:hypothetical protein